MKGLPVQAEYRYRYRISPPSFADVWRYRYPVCRLRCPSKSGCEHYSCRLWPLCSFVRRDCKLENCCRRAVPGMWLWCLQFLILFTGTWHLVMNDTIHQSDRDKDLHVHVYQKHRRSRSIQVTVGNGTCIRLPPLSLEYQVQVILKGHQTIPLAKACSIR